MQVIARILIIWLLTPNSSLALGASFFDQSNQYKGFYWFEDPRQEQSNAQKQEYKIPTPEQAESIVEARKKKLDGARNQMIAVGFDENATPQAKREAVMAYRKLEMGMWDGALSLVDASDMANFINPEIVDNLNHPTNVYAVKSQRKLIAEQSTAMILEFSKDFELLLFTESACPYCREFAPVIQSFAKQYNFQLDAVSLDSKAGAIARSLGITGVPTLVAVKKDGSQLFEVSRGMVSISQLEESFLLAIKYSKELMQKAPQLKQRNKPEYKR